MQRRPYLARVYRLFEGCERGSSIECTEHRERHQQLVRRLRAIRGLLLKRLHDDARDRVRNIAAALRDRHWYRLHMCRHQLMRRHIVKRWLTAEHLVCQASK